MEPTCIIDREQITLFGFSFFGDPFRASSGWTEENEIGRLWQRFSAYLERNAQQLPPILSPGASYEVHIEQAETLQTGEYEVFVGLETSGVEAVPFQLAVKILPPARYAVFSLAGDEILSDWPRQIELWLQQSGQQRAYTYGFQRYDERFKGLDQIAESRLDVYVPIRS